MDISGICDLLRSRLYGTDFEYGFCLDGKRYAPAPGAGFDAEFARLCATVYRVQDPEITLRERIGTCIDAVAAMKWLLDQWGVPARIWRLYDAARKKPHTVLTFEAEDRTVYLELTPRSSRPWYGREIVYPDAEAFREDWRQKGFEVAEITNDVMPGQRPEFMFR